MERPHNSLLRLADELTEVYQGRAGVCVYDLKLNKDAELADLEEMI